MKRITTILVALTVPAYAYGNSPELTSTKLPAASCSKDFGFEDPEGTLFLGSGTLTLQNGSGDVHFSCPLTMSRGTISRVRAYYLDSDGAAEGANMRIGIVRTSIDRSVPGSPRISAGEICAFNTSGGSPNPAPRSSTFPCSATIQNGEFYFLEVRLTLQGSGEISFLGAEIPR